MSYSISINFKVPFDADFSSFTDGPATVCALADGNFMIVQQHDSSNPDHIHTQIFDSFGMSLGTQHVISFAETSLQGAPSQLASGNIVILTRDADSLGFTIVDQTGAAVRATTDIADLHPAAAGSTNGSVAALRNGGFVVAYQEPFNGPDTDIHAVIYDSAGNSGVDVLIDTSITTEDHPAVCGLAGGGFAVAWESGSTIRYALYNDDGSVRLNQTTIPASLLASVNTRPAIAALPDGGFEIVYASNLASGTDTDIIGARFDSGGQLLQGASVQASAGNDMLPSIAVRANGDIVVGSTDAAGDAVITVLDGLTGQPMGSIDTTLANTADASKGSGVSFLPDGHIVSVYTDTAGLVHGTIASLVPERTWTSDDAGDLMLGSDDKDIMFGNGGDDILLGGVGNDVLVGGSGNDRLEGNAGRDTVDGGDGDDIIVVASAADGVDDVFGGNDNDSFDLSAVATASADINLTTGKWILKPGLSLPGVIDGIETVIGTQLNDTITGSALADTLRGNGGNDLIRGEAGADTLTGGGGSDEIWGGEDADIISGGLGGDIFHFSAASELAPGESIDGGAEAVTIDSIFLDAAGLYQLAAAVQVSHIDRISFNAAAIGFALEVSDAMAATADANGDGKFGDLKIDANAGMGGFGVSIDASGLGGSHHVVIDGANMNGADNIVGGGGADSIASGAGADIVSGLGGKDVLSGGGGGDRLDGGAGRDRLSGDNGTDVLIGGLANDVLTGGSGSDVFRYDAPAEGGDFIMDFSSQARGNNDSFEFTGANFGGLAPGSISASQFQSSTLAVAGNASVRFFFETDTGILRFDADGSAAASVVIATLQPGASVSVNDIHII